MDYKRRVRRLQVALDERHLDALLVTHLPNLRYLTGFTGSSGALLLTEANSVFFTDGRYTEQAHSEVASARVVIGKSGPGDLAADWLLSRRKRYTKLFRVGIEADHVSVATKRRFSHMLGKSFRIGLASSLVEGARLIKDGDEINQIRRAAQVGEKLFSMAKKAIRAADSEAKVAAEMEFSAKIMGAEGMSFPTIVLGGKRSALPHGRASLNPIPSGGFVVCDFGVILAGYCSDRTRTVFKGKPPEQAKAVYQAVLEAQQAGIEAVRPGATASEVDAACRKLLQSRSLAKYFTHSTGHGVGLEIHEAPRLAAGQTQVLQPGMVVTIEPGVYIPGKWGVRIEDMVLVTDKGREILAPDDKDLIAVS